MCGADDAAREFEYGFGTSGILFGLRMRSTTVTQQLQPARAIWLGINWQTFRKNCPREKRNSVIRGHDENKIG
jgi:hypothetical protein